MGTGGITRTWEGSKIWGSRHERPHGRSLAVSTATLKQRCSTTDIIRTIFSIILPPLGVFLQVGVGKHFWINIVLTMLGYVPGIIHAIGVI